MPGFFNALLGEIGEAGRGFLTGQNVARERTRTQGIEDQRLADEQRRAALQEAVLQFELEQGRGEAQRGAQGRRELGDLLTGLEEDHPLSGFTPGSLEQIPSNVLQGLTQQPRAPSQQSENFERRVAGIMEANPGMSPTRAAALATSDTGLQEGLGIRREPAPFRDPSLVSPSLDVGNTRQRVMAVGRELARINAQPTMFRMGADGSFMDPEEARQEAIQSALAMGAFQDMAEFEEAQKRLAGVQAGQPVPPPGGAASAVPGVSEVGDQSVPTDPALEAFIRDVEASGLPRAEKDRLIEEARARAAARGAG
jgi:hypothetical protein